MATLENPYYQYFCGEEFFCHKPPFDRSSMTRWRQHMGEARLMALLQESLAAATRTGAAKPADFTALIVDTTVQPKAIAHTLAHVVPEITQQLGVSLQRIVADAGYRGHNAPTRRGLSVFTSGQKRGVTAKIKRELRRRSVVEPVIGHLKAGHRMDRNYLKGHTGDAANALLAAAGYNFRLLIAWIRLLWAFMKSTRSENPASCLNKNLRLG